MIFLLIIIGAYVAYTASAFQDLFRFGLQSGALIEFTAVERIVYAALICAAVLIFWRNREVNAIGTVIAVGAAAIFGICASVIAPKINHFAAEHITGVSGERWVLCQTYISGSGRNTKRHHIYSSNQPACDELWRTAPGLDYTPHVAQEIRLINDRTFVQDK